MQRQALRVALLEKRRANAISSADRSRWGCCRIVAPSGTPGAETTRALASLSPLFSQIAPPASVYTMCGELPHCAAHVPPQSWGDVGRKVPRGEGRTRVCYPHEWHQSVPHAHGVLRTAGWACPRDLRAVRAAHPSARGPRKGRARTPSSLSGYHSKPNQIVLYLFSNFQGECALMVIIDLLRLALVFQRYRVNILNNLQDNLANLS